SWLALSRDYYVGLCGFSRDYSRYWSLVENYLNSLARNYSAGLFVRLQRIEIWRNLENAAEFGYGVLRLDESLFSAESGLLWQEAIWHEVITSFLALIEPNRGIREAVATYKSIEHFISPQEQQDENGYQENILSALNRDSFVLAEPLLNIYQDREFPLSDTGTKWIIGRIIESIKQQPRYQAEQIELEQAAQASGLSEIELVFLALHKTQILINHCERLLEVWQSEAPRNNREIVAVNLQLKVDPVRIRTYFSRKLGDLEQPELGITIEALEMLYKLSEFEILHSLLGVVSRPRLEIMSRIFEVLEAGMMRKTGLPLGYQVEMDRVKAWAASMQIPWDMAALRLPDWVKQALFLLDDPQRGEAAHFKHRNLPGIMGCGIGVYVPDGTLDPDAQQKTISALEEAGKHGAIVRSEIISTADMPVYLVSQRMLPSEIQTVDCPPCLWFDSPERFLVGVVIPQRFSLNDEQMIEAGIYLPLALDFWLAAVSPDLRAQIYNHEIRHWQGAQENIEESEQLCTRLLSLATQNPHSSSAKRMLLISLLASQARLYQIKTGNLILASSRMMNGPRAPVADQATARLAFVQRIEQAQGALNELGILINFLSEVEEVIRFVYPQGNFISERIERQFLSDLSWVCSQRIIEPLLIFAHSMSGIIGIFSAAFEALGIGNLNKNPDILGSLNGLHHTIRQQSDEIGNFTKWLNRKLEGLGVVRSFPFPAGRGCGLGVYTAEGDLDLKAQAETFAALFMAWHLGAVKKLEEFSTSSIPVYSVQQSTGIYDLSHPFCIWYNSPERFLLAVAIPKVTGVRTIGTINPGIYLPAALCNFLQQKAPELLQQIIEHERAHWQGGAENIGEAQDLSRRALKLTTLTREKVDQIIAEILANGRYSRAKDERFVNKLIKSFFLNSHNAILYQRISSALENVRIELYTCSGLEHDGYWQMEGSLERGHTLRIFIDRERAGEHFDAKVMHEVAAAVTATFAQAQSGEIRPTSHETNLEIEKDYEFWTASEWAELSGEWKFPLNYIFGEEAKLELLGQ
ncbi:MAG: hypothetical protein PHN59_06795, partial [Candidatus Omnitrophica bacterium]|nr:hypothetical protein [Candidatus Omnitrophota bacterium]